MVMHTPEHRACAPGPHPPRLFAALALGLHLLVWWWWPTPVVHLPVVWATPATSAAVQWVQAPVAAPARAPVDRTSADRSRPGPAPSAPATPSARTPPTERAWPPDLPPPPRAAAAPGVQTGMAAGRVVAPEVDAPADEPRASLPDAATARRPGAWLDNAATRQAIREVAKSTSVSEQHADRMGQPMRSASARLAEAAASSAKGDCLKGEFAGSGMGLLSLPFVAFAAAAGRCAR